MEQSFPVLFHIAQIEPSPRTTHIIHYSTAPLIPRYSNSRSSIPWMPQISSNPSVTYKVASREHCGDCTRTRFYPHKCHTHMCKYIGERKSSSRFGRPAKTAVFHQSLPLVATNTTYFGTHEVTLFSEERNAPASCVWSPEKNII